MIKKRILVFIIYIILTYINLSFALSSRGHYLLGNDYLKKELYPLAIKEYKEAIELNPYYKEAYRGLGKAYYGQELYKEAETFLNKAIELDANYWEAYNDLGILYERQGYLNKAEENYNKAIEISPQVAELHFNLARILVKENRFKRAIEEYKKVTRIKPDYIGAYIDLGDLYSRLGDLDRAAAYYKEAQRYNPRSAHINLADLYLKHGLEKSAEVEYRKALQVSKDKITALNRLSNIYMERKNWDEAIKINKELIKIAPKSSIAHYSLGLAYKMKKDLIKAKEEYSEAIHIDPYDMITRHHLEDLLLQLEPATSVIRREYANHRIELGNKYLLENKLPLAAYAYYRAILLSPQEISPRMKLSELYRYRGLINQTINELIKIRELDPTNKDAILRMEQTYRLLERSIANKESIDPKTLPPSGVSLLLIKLSGKMILHPYLTEQMDEILRSILNEFPQVSIISDKSRDDAMKELGIKKLDKIEDLFRIGKRLSSQYVFYADITEQMDKIELEAKLVDLSTLTEVTRKASSSTNDRIESLPLKMATFIIESIPLEGMVVKIKPQEVIINLGTRHGLKLGRRLDVFHKDELKEGRRLIGQIEVTSLEDTLAKARILTYGLSERLRLYDIVSLVKEG